MCKGFGCLRGPVAPQVHVAERCPGAGIAGRCGGGGEQVGFSLAPAAHPRIDLASTEQHIDVSGRARKEIGVGVDGLIPLAGERQLARSLELLVETGRARADPGCNRNRLRRACVDLRGRGSCRRKQCDMCQRTDQWFHVTWSSGRSLSRCQDPSREILPQRLFRQKKNSHLTTAMKRQTELSCR